MTVRQLIVLLGKVNPDATVLIMGEGDPLYAEISKDFMELPVDGSIVLMPA